MSLGPLMVGLGGPALTPEERELLMHPLVGGVILFGRNCDSAEQVKELVEAIHALREPRLLVAVDQEGGRVQRLKKGFTLLPPLRSLGRLFDRDPQRARHLAEISGWLMAIELRSVDIDLSFAPVLDLDRGISEVIGDRGLHSDPEAVATLAQHYVRGMRRAGMAATGKHFPGHGTVAEDSHHVLPVDGRRFADIEMEDLVPFSRLIDNQLEAVMVAHVVYPQVDTRAAGFSQLWVQDILRRRLKFQGTVFSDDLEMGGAQIAGDVGDRAQAAVEAGCDMILVCKDFSAMVTVIERLEGWKNPVSQLRFSRMHGRFSVDRGRLLASDEWRQAVATVSSYEEPHTLDLI